MKGTLIRKAECWYNLYQDKIGIGSTHSELQGYKLCQKNCDEIFGVVDVENFAKEEFPYDFDCPIFETLGVTEKAHKSILIGMLQGTLIKGFNKAMELNKDKLFTLGDFKLFARMYYREIRMNKSNLLWDSLADKCLEEHLTLMQPTEIEVEIEMRTASLVYKTDEMLPKLDENGCLILKKSAPDRAL